MLADGTYDTIVVDAEVSGDGAGLRLDLTILAGPHKGEVVSMLATGLDIDELEVLALPATLTVAAGEPSVVLDR
jgi:hypothetical protein